MASYELTTIEDGQTVTTIIDADSIEAVKQGALAAGLTPINVVPVDAVAATATASPQDAPVPPTGTPMYITTDNHRRHEPVSPPPPAAPREISLKQSSYLGSSVLIIIGGVFVASASVLILTGLGLLIAGNRTGLDLALFPLIHFSIGVALLFFATPTRRRRRMLAAHGAAAVATVQTVGKIRRVRINKRRPHKITYTFEIGNVSYSGERASIDNELASYRPDDAMWVLYDPANPAVNMEWPPL